MALVLNETDLASLSAPTVACSPNGLGSGTVTGRLATLQGAFGTSEVTVNMAASEAAKVYAMLEVAVSSLTRNWFRTFCTFGFNVTSRNGNVDWVRTDVCHVNAAGASLETVASDTGAVSIGADDPAYRFKTLTLNAATNVALGDRLLILLSFTNNAATVQSFGWTPNLTVTVTDWLPDRTGPEMILKGRQKKRTDDEEGLALLLADDDLP